MYEVSDHRPLTDVHSKHTNIEHDIWLVWPSSPLPLYWSCTYSFCCSFCTCFYNFTKLIQVTTTGNEDCGSLQCFYVCEHRWVNLECTSVYFVANSTWEDKQIPVLLNIFPLAQSEHQPNHRHIHFADLVTVLKAHFNQTNHQTVPLPLLQPTWQWSYCRVCHRVVASWDTL